MAKKIQLTIAEPCHESWDAMTPDAKGKFCGSCQKQVVDFSNMSDRQVAEFFKKPSTGSVCGRFMTDQLDRPIEIPRKRIPWLKYFFQITIPAFLVSLKATASRTQGEIVVNTVAKDTTSKPIYKRMGMVMKPRPIQKPVIGDTIIIPQPVKKPLVIPTPASNLDCSTITFGGVSAVPFKTTVIQLTDQKKLFGLVVDQEGKPIPFASVNTDKKGNGTMANERGEFSLAKKIIGKKGSLIISAAGFESKTVTDPLNAIGILTVELKANVVLTEVVLTTAGQIKCSRVLGSISYIKGETISTKVNNSTADKVTIPVSARDIFAYPNPVAAGGAVHISLKEVTEGYYQLQVLNQSGQVVNRQELWIDAEMRVMDITLPLVVAGSYFMVLTNKKTGKKLTEKIIIQ